jgi:type IV pilus assembly protein PilN
LTNINLLPWREMRRHEKKQAFLIALGASAVSAIIILVPIFFIIDMMITHQQQRNEYLTAETRKLDVKIREIKELKKKKAEMLARMAIIQQLQEDRTNVVRIYDEMVKIVPEGIFLNSIERVGNEFVLSGVSESNAAISSLMRNIEDSALVTKPVLQEINTQQKENLRTRNFTLQMSRKVHTIFNIDQDDLASGF